METTTIKFPCRCGHRFSLEPDLAGGVIQCPSCKRLNDIPTLSELSALLDDGTIDLRDEPQTVDRNREKILRRVFSPTRADQDGNDIDLRNTPEELAGLDAELAPLNSGKRPAMRVARPRYDPETGELIRPLDIERAGADEATPPQAIPVAKRALAYATGESARRVTAGSIFIELCRPMNMFVMFFVVLAHVYAYVAMMVTSIFFIMFLAWFAAPFALLAHYANVIDDIGPCDRDELPRPLRNVDFHDDLWGAMVAIASGLMIGFSPWIITIAVTFNMPDESPLHLILNALGLFVSLLFAPAIVLTTTTSGSIFNVRPDRVLSVINTLGFRYILLMVLGMVTFVVYGLGILGGNLPFLAYTFPSLKTLWFLNYTVSAALILLGVFLAHWYCWYTAMLYREHHTQFPWVNQRHVSTPRAAQRA